MRRLALLTLALTLAVCGSAAARDPGRWTLAGWSSVSNNYWQGVSSAGPGQPLFFTGPVEGLHRTARNLRQTGSVGSVIPPSVKAVEGYNHVGDPGFQGGRVLLPLECYTPGGPNGGNTCGTGSIGVADPAMLGFEYYVKLDPAEIPKAMWVEAQGDLLWTSSGPDLLAYRASDVSAGNAAPGAAPIRAVRRLPGAVPPSGVTGAAIYRGRLLLAGTQGTTYQVWSVDTDTGARRLELELPRVQGEAEGLTQIPLLGGRLHFVVAPLAANPTFGPSVGMLHFATGRWARRGLRVTVRASRQSSRRPRVHARVTRRGVPVENAVVTVAGTRTTTNARGRATVRPSLAVPGTFAAMAHRGRRRGRSKFVRLGEAPAAAGPSRTTPAG
ncbi:MAG TPA: hypothetical protein VE449_03665 [Thermoleophilaceae bacterium]|jgi:hypothetical protein|nr:hypothetical protein [Thermoleophilaceae bacterium]